VLQNIFVVIFGNPFVCYILLMLGMYLLLFGIASEEGEMIVGGIICLGLSIVGIVFLEIEISSIILFIVGIGLFIGEAATEGSLDGILAVGGLICTIGGGAFFIQTLSAHIDPDLVVVMWATMLTFTIVLAVVFGGITWKVIDIKKRGAVDKFIPEPGDIGVVKEDLKPEGQVSVKGEAWSAECLEGDYAVKGDKVVVVKVEGVHLIVRSVDMVD
jgi:membrane-bound ClpP family serine protease